MEALATVLQDRQRFPQGPSALALIGGPSKTADIEGIMIKGMHGPSRLSRIGRPRPIRPVSAPRGGTPP